MASYDLRLTTDTLVLIEDQDNGRSVTNDASNVIAELNSLIEGGLKRRRVYYRDTSGRYDELKHLYGKFVGFAPCSAQQQIFLNAQL